MAPVQEQLLPVPGQPRALPLPAPVQNLAQPTQHPWMLQDLWLAWHSYCSQAQQPAGLPLPLTLHPRPLLPRLGLSVASVNCSCSASPRLCRLLVFPWVRSSPQMSPEQNCLRNQPPHRSAPPEPLPEQA